VIRRLLVLGAGGHGHVVADAAIDAGFDEVAFLDDQPPQLNPAIPFSVIGGFGDLGGHADWGSAIAAVGDNALRLHLVDRIRRSGFEAPSVIHPRAVVSRHARFGAGCFLAAGAVVNIGASLGDAAIVNTGATIDHDCVLGEGVHVSPGAHLGGNVTVGDRTWIGIGAAVRHGVSIGKDVIVGAGASVVRDVPDGETVIGVPAKPQRQAQIG
jgi:sugar O-acyltransferase (sialic acid O-acetyltransferase NeuD family)